MRPIIGITMGDPAGIGAEVTVKALNRKTLYRQCIPVVIGDYAAIEDAIHFCNLSLSIRCIDHPNHATGTYGILELIDLHCLPKEDWRYQEVSASCGELLLCIFVSNLLSNGRFSSCHCYRTNQ
jgi:4-hydroxythreonine-4-phosphate dehydrogenase